MQDNPYGSFWDLLHRDAGERAASVWITGRIVTVDPMVVRCGGQDLSGKDLLINAALLPCEMELRQTGLQGGLEGDPGTTITGGALGSTAHTESPLQQGDQVLLLPSSDGQQFAVVCKLISAS